MIILPHGGWALIPATLATMAWMTALSLDGCDNVRLTGPAVETLTQSNIYPYVEMGFQTYRIPNFYSNYQSWEIRLNDPRLSYGKLGFSHTSLNDFDNLERDNLDAVGKSDRDERDDSSQSITVIDPSRGFFWVLGSMSHKLGVVFGGSATLFLWVPCLCLSYSERTWRIGGLQLLSAAFFHLFSFVWLFNSLCLERASKCRWHYGSFATLISFLLYTVSFFCVFLRYPKPVIVRLVQERIEQEFQRYQRNHRPDLTSSYDSRRTNKTEPDSYSIGSQSSDHRMTSLPVTIKNTTSRRLMV